MDWVFDKSENERLDIFVKGTLILLKNEIVFQIEYFAVRGVFYNSNAEVTAEVFLCSRVVFTGRRCPWHFNKDIKVKWKMDMY